MREPTTRAGKSTDTRYRSTGSGRRKRDPELPFISVVVPARNERRTIAQSIGSLLDQTYPADRFEVIVVDGDSDDGTSEIIRALAADEPRLRLIRNPKKITPIALNLGIAAARGDIVARLDGHAFAQTTYLERAATALVEMGAWSVGGAISRTCDSPTRRAICAATMSPFGVGDASHNYATDARWVETAFPGMWPRWVFEKVGLFDTELVRNQDDEMSFRIRESGGGIWYDPAIVLQYVPRATFRGLFNQYRQYAMWKVRVFQKHPGAARPRHLITPLWVGSMVAGLLLWPVNGLGPLLTLMAVGAYGAVLLVAVARIDRRGATTLSVLWALATLHFAYGLGFWQGVVRFAPRWIVDRKGALERLERREPA